MQIFVHGHAIKDARLHDCRDWIAGIDCELLYTVVEVLVLSSKWEAALLSRVGV